MTVYGKSTAEKETAPIFDGYISEVTFGSEVAAETLAQLTAHIANHCRANNIKILRQVASSRLLA
jgi:translation initiation factor IF-1